MDESESCRAVETPSPAGQWKLRDLQGSGNSESCRALETPSPAGHWKLRLSRLSSDTHPLRPDSKWVGWSAPPPKGAAGPRPPTPLPRHGRRERRPRPAQGRAVPPCPAGPGPAAGYRQWGEVDFRNPAERIGGPGGVGVAVSRLQSPGPRRARRAAPVSAPRRGATRTRGSAAPWPTRPFVRGGALCVACAERDVAALPPSAEAACPPALSLSGEEADAMRMQGVGVGARRTGAGRRLRQKPDRGAAGAARRGAVAAEGASSSLPASRSRGRPCDARRATPIPS